MNENIPTVSFRNQNSHISEFLHINALNKNQTWHWHQLLKNINFIRFSNRQAEAAFTYMFLNSIHIPSSVLVKCATNCATIRITAVIEVFENHPSMNKQKQINQANSKNTHKRMVHITRPVFQLLTTSSTDIQISYGQFPVGHYIGYNKHFGKIMSPYLMASLAEVEVKWNFPLNFNSGHVHQRESLPLQN